MSDWIITLHWTVTGYAATDHSKECYHFIVEGDGNVVKGKHDVEDNADCTDGDYAAHVYHANTRNIGVALASMIGAKEAPLDLGACPYTEPQLRAAAALIAQLARKYNVPIEPTRVLTHAEIEPTLGIKQKGKWDITVVPWRPELRGHKAVGDYIRSVVAEFFIDGDEQQLPTTTVTEQTRPMLAQNSKHYADVKYLQWRMRQLGLYSGKVDGLFGPQTLHAVLRMQEQFDLNADGKVGKATWAALERAKE